MARFDEAYLSDCSGNNIRKGKTNNAEKQTNNNNASLFANNARTLAQGSLWDKCIKKYPQPRKARTRVEQGRIT